MASRSFYLQKLYHIFKSVNIELDLNPSPLGQMFAEVSQP